LLTSRGRLALLLGVAVYVGAWAFGAVALYPVAVGLPLAVAAAWLWVRVLNRPFQLRRVSWRDEHYEGEDLSVNLELTSEGRVVPPALTLVEELDRLGSFEVPLRRAGRRLVGRYTIPQAPRGRYRTRRTWVAIEDPFRLERVDVELPSAGALLVYPRLVELDRLFSESGSRSHEGRRLLVRRPSGFDLHSVRDYERGDSLRKVHWRTTARRGQLMVKELEDAPRDEVAVLLDATEGVTAGAPPDSSFDLQVRAAGSILGTHARRGRSTALVLNTAEGASHSVRGRDGDWRRALDLLAAAEPDGRTPSASLLVEDASPAARAQDLTVVTGHLPAALVERLLQRALSRRGVSVVFVDPTSFGAAQRQLREPGLLRLQAAGVPVAVLRRGDDLRAKLGEQALAGVSAG
jgi:uncharacterized protein (DUF58 family)